MDKRTKRQNNEKDKNTKLQKDKKGEITEGQDKKTKREFNVVMSGQFRTFAMFLICMKFSFQLKYEPTYQQNFGASI